MTTIQGLPEDLGSPLGVLVAAASLYLPRDLVLPQCPLSSREALVAPLSWGSLSLRIPIVQQLYPSPASQLVQREPIVPTRTGPCPAAHLRDGHLTPVSPPPVPMLPHPPWGWGAASTNRLEDSTAQPSAPRLLSCAHLSVCLSVLL